MKEEGCITLCLFQSFAATGISMAAIWITGRVLLGIFNGDPAVVDVGMVRFAYCFIAYFFSLIQETLSGYLRGFGFSLLPAVCSVAGVCGTRFIWIATLFRASPDFSTLMLVYPVSVAITALAFFVATFVIRPSRRDGRL